MGQLSTVDYELDYKGDVLPGVVRAKWDEVTELGAGDSAVPADILIR